MDEKDINIYTGEILPEKREDQPRNMIQMKSDRCVAMLVPKPRMIEKVKETVLKEAKFAKDDFYYGWFVKNNRTGKKEWIEGGTIGLAQAMYRAWNNCELVTNVREEAGQWIFTSILYDFENGSTTNREHRVRIPHIDLKDYDYDRKIDMKFQAWYSKNQRNTIFAALPRWLKNKGISAAKIASQNEIKGDKKEKFEKALKYLNDRGISEKDIFLYFSKESTEDFGIEDVSRVCNIANQLYNKEITPTDILNQIKEDFEEEKIKKPGKERPSSKPKSETPKKERTQEKKENGEVQMYLKSLEIKGISEVEVCAYFLIDEISQIDIKQIEELKKITVEIESESGMTPNQFIKEAAEKYEMMLQMKKKGA